MGVDDGNSLGLLLGLWLGELVGSLLGCMLKLGCCVGINDGELVG